MKNQPILHLPVSTTERMLDAVSLLFAAGTMLLVISLYGALPDQIPTHFNARGEIDQNGPKIMAFILPAIALVLCLSLFFLARVPHQFNYMTKITPENAAAEYRRAGFLVRLLNALTSLLFLVLTWNVIQAAQGTTTTLSVLFWMVFFLLMLAPVVYLMVRRKP